MERVVWFSDPRMRGDHDNPNIFANAEAAEFAIGREQGIILEWRALLDGEVYARHWFSSVAFDMSLDPSRLDRTGIPADVTIER